MGYEGAEEDSVGGRIRYQTRAHISLSLVASSSHVARPAPGVEAKVHGRTELQATRSFPILHHFLQMGKDPGLDAV